MTQRFAAQRRAPVLLSIALVLGSGASFAQTPPPDVDQALRGHVAEFFQDFVDGKYRQALNLVAEDTQDEYFSAPKMEIKEFRIDGISYSSDFKSATVKLTVKRVWKLKADGFLNDSVIDTPMDTAWRIENDKWVWSNHTPKGDWLTPMGPSSGDKLAEQQSGVPKKIDQATMDAKAMEILGQGQSNVTPNQVTFQPGKASSAKLKFHNGVPGSVRLSIDPPPAKTGLTAKLGQTDLGAGADTTIEIEYNPPPDAPTGSQIARLAVVVEPFGQTLPVEILLVPAN